MDQSEWPRSVCLNCGGVPLEECLADDEESCVCASWGDGSCLVGADPYDSTVTELREAKAVLEAIEEMLSRTHEDAPRSPQKVYVGGAIGVARRCLREAIRSIDEAIEFSERKTGAWVDTEPEEP